MPARPLLALGVLLAATCFATAAPAAGTRAPYVVTPAWLAAHLHDPELVVLHVAGLRRDYTAGHVPGARYLWTGALAQGTPEMSYEVVPLARIRDELAALGVSNRSRIVLCGTGGNVSPVARMYLTLEYAGLGDSTSVLDGQLEAWKAEGHPVSAETPVFARGALQLRPHADVFVPAEWVRDRLHTPGVTIVDARAPQFYAGANGGQPRSGHVPGAKNLFFATLFDSTNRLLPRAQLEERFHAAGIAPGDEIAAYCHVGQTASAVVFAAELLGHHAHLYDGSWDEWGGRLDLPVELPAKADSTKH